jgi:16S rRNA (cytidine1402-2'-O)-methyltransferase
MPYEEPVIQLKKNINSPASPGKLYLLASHIGCTDDIPPRALALLKSADLLIFEEDRPARLVLKCAGIHRPYCKFSEHGEEDTITALEDCLRAGKTATYMSDQGCAQCADPGQKLVALAYRLGAKVLVIPGPSSITAAVMACGFSLSNFYFAGFLPQKKEKRLSEIKKLLTRKEPIILLDTPYRLAALLQDFAGICPPGRRGFLALDITGPEEAYLSGGFAQLAQKVGESSRLNFVLIIEGA